jgi:hypothetical protein
MVEKSQPKATWDNQAYSSVRFGELLTLIAGVPKDIGSISFAELLQELCRMLKVLNKHTSLACEDIFEHSQNIIKNHTWHSNNERGHLTL